METSSSTLKILIVEDEIIPLYTLKKHLEKAGHQVIDIAADSPTALQAVQNYHPDAVFMDVHLNGKMKGLAAGELIQQCYQIPVVYTANSSEMVQLTPVPKKPMCYLLGKPFEEHKVIEILLLLTEQVTC